MNAEGMDVISLGIGSPDMPPSEKTIRTLCEAACNPDGHGYMPYVGIPELRRGLRTGTKMVRCSIESQHRDTTAHRLQRRYLAYLAGILESGGVAYWFRTREYPTYSSAATGRGPFDPLRAERGTGMATGFRGTGRKWISPT